MISDGPTDPLGFPPRALDEADIFRSGRGLSLWGMGGKGSFLLRACLDWIDFLLTARGESTITPEKKIGMTHKSMFGYGLTRNYGYIL